MTADSQKRDVRTPHYLVPTDFSPLAQFALESIVTMIEGQPGATLTLLHVVEPWNLQFLSGSEVPQPLMVPVRMERAERELEQLQGVYDGRVGVKTRVVSGTVSQMICEVAKRDAMNGIILCSHGHADLAHTTIGSVAERVAQEAPCPVLLVKVPKDTAGQFVMVRVQPTVSNILVGYDHRAGSEQALSAAINQAKGRSVRITLVHALEPPPPTLDNMSPAVDASLIDKAKSWLLNVIERHSTPTVEWQMVVAGGHPWKLLVETAKELGSDLIVVGPHDHTGWRHCFLGSTAQRVVRLAPCSVLAVK